MTTQSTERQILLTVIVGPTAVGKTDIAIQLAERLNGEIVSADSRLFYRGMDIGTAKPSLEDRTRVTHHLIDIADPNEVWTLADFQEAAHKAILQIDMRGRNPFLVGGTGQYVRAVIEGWQIPRTPPNPRLRQILEAWGSSIGPDSLHNRLKALDHRAADRIDPNNMRRTIRALEVILSTGHRFSSQKRRGPARYTTLVLGLNRPREALYQRIDTRLEDMIQRGFLTEVSGLLIQGIDPNSPALSAIGYKEFVAHLKGQLTFDEAVLLIKRRTRQFVRRQANWFKANDPGILWFPVKGDTVDRLERRISAFIGDRA